MSKKRKRNNKRPTKSSFRKKPQFIGLESCPPTTERFCLVCNKMRRFKYNKFIGHSECKVCGCRESRKEK